MALACMGVQAAIVVVGRFVPEPFDGLFTIVFLAALSLCGGAAVGALRGQGTTNRGVGLMAAAWGLIIIGLAFRAAYAN